MSNAIRYDSVLVRELARELRHMLVGRRASALLLDREAATVSLRSGRDALVWDLDPRRGGVRRLTDAERWSGNVPLPRDALVTDVAAPRDERILTFAWRPEAEPADAVGAGTLLIELIAPRWNAVALGQDGRIHAVLRPRTTGDRPLVPGLPYSPPPRGARAGADALLPLEAWCALLEPLAAAERASTLLRAVAWTSPLNISHILGDAAFASDNGMLRDAWERYRALVEPAGMSPCVLKTARGSQPYPFALSDVPCVPALSLLDGFGALAAELPAPEPSAHTAAAIEKLRRQHERLDARRSRLAEELQDAAPQADALRRQADLLLAQLHQVRRGFVEVELDDFQGGTLRVVLDPALSPADNARRIYDAARKRERAAARLPALLRRTEDELARVADTKRRIEAGELDAREIVPAAAPAASATPASPALPYRRYRTSGGLEVRVGRGAASNDQLTLHHSSPEDIWLHARQVAGAHVVLRWTDRNANPPQADLVEAAVLAALHSRARTSATVPVDWTRRKYVRKPRKSKPGLVLVERARTLFVSPDERVERRLRAFS